MKNLWSDFSLATVEALHEQALWTHGGDVHRCLPSRVTAATGLAVPAASCLVVSPHFQGLLFDSDGS